MDGPVFCFGCFRLVARERVLVKDNAPVHLGSRAFDLLLALVERAGETVNREELFERVWPDVIVTKVNLRVHIAGLRKALGEGQDGKRFIASVAGRGYCFVAAVSRFRSVVPAAQLTRYPTAPRPLRLERSFERDSAIATLSSQFSRKRLISLAEPAGWTSVALAIACTLVTHFDDALCFVDLADIDDPAQVEMAVAFALGCEVTLQQSRSGVLAYLQNKELLLVFDNCDHVLAGVAQLTERLFTAAPLVHILVNSHQTIRLSHLARGDTRSVAPVSA